ncbi:MAG: AAA family ATPase [Desulfobacterales bacterium]|nr:AAA family ATPase [Desulfobacterales bacterium]
MYYILHLSDLHFGTSGNASKWSYQLTMDLNKLGCEHLDGLIISGDIANKSTKKEYEAAKKFLDDLKREFHLENIVIVPGNHDLNWDLSKEAYTYKPREDYKEPFDKNDVIDLGTAIGVRNEEKYQQRFNHFKEFYENISKNKNYPLEHNEQGILYHFPESNLLILGVNSAWNLDHHHRRERISINTYALIKALKKIRLNREIYEECFKFAVWHHPISNMADQSFMQMLSEAKFCLVFNGHIHRAENQYYKDSHKVNEKEIDIICAGTFGASIKEMTPGYPLQYNLLKLKGNKITVETRKREDSDGVWKPDPRWVIKDPENPQARYHINLPFDDKDKLLTKKFIDRFDELKTITGVYCANYQLIYAPAGYGKTRLIKYVKTGLARNWYPIYLTLCKPHYDSIRDLANIILTSIDEEYKAESKTSISFGAELGKVINKKFKNRDIVIIIDQAEQLSENLEKNFFHEFIPALQEELYNNNNIGRKFRIIWATTRATPNLGFKYFNLSLFNFNEVYKTVETFDEERNSKQNNNYKIKFAHHLMYYTGGHPWCMAKILSEGYGKPIHQIASNEKEYFNNIVKPIIDKIKEEIPDDLKILDMLCVVRRFNDSLLQYLIDDHDDLKKWSKELFKLEDVLTTKYPFYRKKGFLQDDITRCLFAIHFRNTDVENYIAICEKAICFYDSQIEIEGRMQEIIVIELFFQKLCLYIIQKQEIQKKYIIELFENILNKLGNETDILSEIEENFQQDWELRFILHYLFIGTEDIDSVNSLYNELLEKIKNHRPQIAPGEDQCLKK